MGADLVEHCRHKQFNASWTIDGVEKDFSLFSMIRNTHRKNLKYVISAYSDNAGMWVLDIPLRWSLLSVTSLRWKGKRSFNFLHAHELKIFCMRRR